jgi:hypothetical protein
LAREEAEIDLLCQLGPGRKSVATNVGVYIPVARKRKARLERKSEDRR